MCGVLGYKTKTGEQLSEKNLELRKNISKALFLAMIQRGKDSTGLALIENGKSKIYKDIVSSDKFIDDKMVNKLLARDYPIMIGHTRLATVGVIKKENAHPFKKGNIIGCHNGSVSNYLEFDNIVNVDSEVIFSELDKDKNRFHKTFKKLSGDFAILWSNLSEPNNLYFVAHDNPLAIAQVPELDTYFLCSHELDLEMILRATGLKYRLFEVKEDRVYKLDSDNKVIEDKIKFKKDYCLVENWKDYSVADNLKGDYVNEYEDEDEFKEDELRCTFCGIGITDKFYYNDYTAEAVCEDCFPEMKEYGYAGGYQLLELSNKNNAKKYEKQA